MCDSENQGKMGKIEWIEKTAWTDRIMRESCEKWTGERVVNVELFLLQVAVGAFKTGFVDPRGVFLKEMQYITKNHWSNNGWAGCVDTNFTLLTWVHSSALWGHLQSLVWNKIIQPTDTCVSPDRCICHRIFKLAEKCGVCFWCRVLILTHSLGKMQ